MGNTSKTAGFLPQSRVDHSVYGLGTITQTSERYTTIAFDTAGTRKFLTAMVQLVGSDVPAPVRSGRRKKAVVQRA